MTAPTPTLEEQLEAAKATIAMHEAQLQKLGAAAFDASEAMARIRLVHDTAEGARAAWRIARAWQEAHA